MLKAKRLLPGGTIGVISPASPSENRSEVYRAAEYLEHMGYRVVIGENVNKTRGFTAGSEEDRAADFNEMFSRGDIDAVWATQGGYGSAQIVDLIDYDNVKAHPKIFCGYSDITSLHLALGRFAGLVTFHGPGMTRFNDEHLTQYTKERFFRAVGGAGPLGEIELADGKKWLNPIAGGVAEGELIGGNLSLICASMGTPYEPDLDGKILLLEEVDQEPWLVDNSLLQLRNAGKLQNLAGAVVAECVNCVPFRHNPGFFSDTSLEDVLEYYLGPLGVPVLYGLPLGHTRDLATLPLGVRVRLDADEKALTVLESGVE